MLHVFIVLAPLLGALATGLAGRRLGDRGAGLATSGLLGLAALLAWVALFRNAGTPAFTVPLTTWLSVGSLEVAWALRVDGLSSIMLAVVTTVSFLIHVYSIGYMEDDRSVPRFMSYLSLFTFFMLMLVTSDNLLQLYFGWEGVGVASYLLIGFWYARPSANAAAMKAFIVNRVGDVGLALGLAGFFLVTDSVQFDTIFGAAAGLKDARTTLFGADVHTLTVLCMLLFIGAMGKSAQLGLHTWLPDAMEGPTPVSALIHAATMVTAGVFLVARFSPVFEYSPVALAWVTVIGASTCLFAATVALVQHDIKRVIAYSTCSQLGYMFFACGVGAYATGMFHLVTHAFFKALLFLGAGSVIHALGDEQDMRRMGGLWRKVPMTYGLMWLGTLALVGFGIPGVTGFAGFYSKDAILEAAWVSPNAFAGYAFGIGLLVAVLTAFYSARLMLLTFHGAPRATPEVMAHVHESPRVMLGPLLVLALGAVAAGALGTGLIEPDGAFWAGAIVTGPDNHVLHELHEVPWLVGWAPTLAMALGLALAWLFYAGLPGSAAKVATAAAPLDRLFRRKWWFDDLYDLVFVRPARALGRLLWQGGDVGLIDRLGPDGLGLLSLATGRRAMRAQTGYVYHYAFVMLVGVAGLVTWYLFAGSVAG